MFDWLKYKKILEDHKPSDVVAEPAKLTRDELIAQARSNAQIAREAIGEEKLSKIRDLIEKSQNQPSISKVTSPVSPPSQSQSQSQKNENREPSPMEQARKILQHAQSIKLLDQLRAMNATDKSKH